MKIQSIVPLCLLAAPVVLCGQTRISLGGSLSNRAVGSPARGIQSADAPPEGSGAVSEITGPTLGFVFDRAAGVVRRVPGIMGAAGIGDPIQAGFSLAQAYTAPQQDYVVGVTTRGLAVTLISLSHGAVSNTTSLNMVPAGPDRVAFSPSGDSIALYYQSDRRLLALTGIPRTPRILSSSDLTAYPGNLTALAVADGGSAVLAGITQGSAGVLTLYRQDGSSSVILPMSRPAAAQFLWESTDAVVTDQAQGTVDFLKDVTGSMQVRLLSDAGNGLGGPDLVAVDRSGGTVLVGHSGTGAGIAIDLASTTIHTFDCHCVLSTLEPLNGSMAYRITDVNAGKFTMLDGRGSTPVFTLVSQPPSSETCNSGARESRTGPNGSIAPAANEPKGCRPPRNRGGLQ